ncbi:MAG: uridine kinase family protein [Jatrophihabitantaceae bacterium]
MGARRVSRAEAVDTIAHLPAGGARFVGVDGFGGSGKTSFAGLVADAVPDAVVVHIDDFAGPSVPEWDWERFRAQVLLPLMDGRPARYQRWDWPSDRGAEWHDIPAGGLVVVEGVSSTRREVGVPWALTVWVDARSSVRLRRAVERDGPELLDRWLTDWMPSEQAYAAREHPQDRVDLVVSGEWQGG